MRCPRRQRYCSSRCREDHQTGSGADDERVDVNGERLSETLLDGVRDLSRRGGLRAGTLTGFGRVDTALHAPHDGRAEDCTERSFLIEGAAENEAEHGGNSRDICPQNDDHQYNIHTSHERNDVAGERADALGAAGDDDGKEDRDDDAGDQRRNVESVAHGVGDVIGLHGGTGQAKGHHCGESV